MSTVRDGAIEIGPVGSVGPISESHGEIGVVVGPISIRFQSRRYFGFAACGGETAKRSVTRDGATFAE